MRCCYAFLLVTLSACVGGPTKDLPLATAPVLPTIVAAVEVLAPVTATTFTATAGSSAIVQVRGTKADGTPVGNASVRFVVNAGGGTVTPIVATTDQTGLASTTWKFGLTTGVHLLIASSGVIAPVSFTVTVGPAATSGIHTPSP